MGNTDGNGKDKNGKAKAEDQGAVALVLDLAKAFERVRPSPVVWALATSNTTGECSLQVVRQSHCKTSAILPGSRWSCLLLRIVLQDALSEVTKIYPPLKLRVFCG